MDGDNATEQKSNDQNDESDASFIEDTSDIIPEYTITDSLGVMVKETPTDELRNMVLGNVRSRSIKDDMESTMVEVDSDESRSEDMQDEEQDEREEEFSSHGEDSDESDEAGEETAEELFRKLSAENRIAHRIIDDNDLPPTVSLLHGDKGQKVYLIGTAHFSKESCEDVRKVISQAQPDVVMIELCRGRTDLLINDEETLSKLAGDASFDKVLTQVKRKGLVSGLMTFLLLHMSAHITKQLGMAPGGEFRAAYQESRKVPGCKLLFGDRAVEVTLQRAFGTFSLWQKLKFAFCVLKDLGPIKKEDIEKLKEKDMLEQALGEMMGEFPEMTNVFLAERDVYLAHSLQLAAGNEICTETGSKPTVVVGVVGLGHVGGIKENFPREITLEEMNKLMEVPQESRMKKAIKMCLKLSFVFGLGYGLYRFTSWTGVFQYLYSTAVDKINITNTSKSTEL
ncbi:traB domain-containing protein-like [Styela clava]